MADDETDVLIAGAGPTGMVLALWLARQGIRVRIIDKAAGTGTASRALAVQGRTLEFYRMLGLDRAAVEAGLIFRAINFHVDGRHRARAEIGLVGAGLSPHPYVLILPQDAHERLLEEALNAAGVRVDWRTELAGFDHDARGVTARLRRDGGAEESCRAAWLCGADGARSTVRAALGVGFPGGTYARTFYVADVEGTGAAINGELHVSLAARDFCIAFPLRGAGRARLVGIATPAHEAGGDAALAALREQAAATLGITVSAVNWLSTYHVHHRVARAFRRGRVFLAGDAAHVHSPVGGQGMNTGIGDAVNLAWKLAMVIRGQADESVLDTYEPERIAFARRLVNTTDRAFRAAVDEGALARFVRMRIVPLIFPRLIARAWWRRLAFRTVSQTAIHYRHSALSAGRAGRVRGGDRLPYVAGRDGDIDGNFAPLTARDWQVHVYGRARASFAKMCKARGLALHVFAYDRAARQAGLARDGACLIRPDGHVALALARQDGRALERWLDGQGLRFGPPTD
jgi:2-polyprenyl-6-methoxyphenol hydroxylase-like FAD-dependent oxidoreductase